MLLTPDQLREHLANEVAVNDDVLRVLLDANERAIERRVGPVYQATETIYTRGLVSRLPLKREPASVSSVVSFAYWSSPTGTTLTGNLYRIRGNTLERTDGLAWGYRVVVEYQPIEDAAERIIVLVELVKCDLNYEPGMSSVSGGGSSESYSANHQAERELILDRLAPAPLFA